MKQNTFNILFYIRRGQLNKQGEGGIMVLKLLADD